MKHHINPSSSNWQGRNSDNQLYWHELVQLVDDLAIKGGEDAKIALLGYAVDAGVINNGGRSGAKDGPDSIRNMLGPLANHLNDAVSVYDYGNIMQILCRTLPERFILSVCLLLLSPICRSRGCKGGRLLLFSSRCPSVAAVRVFLLPHKSLLKLL